MKNSLSLLFFDKRCAKVIAEEVSNVAEYLGLAQNPGNREW